MYFVLENAVKNLKKKMFCLKFLEMFVSFINWLILNYYEILFLAVPQTTW